MARELNYLSKLEANTDLGLRLGKNAKKLARSFVAVFSTNPESQISASSRIQDLLDWYPTRLISFDRRIELAFTDAKNPIEEESLSVGQCLHLVVGDDAEWEDTNGHSCMANAASVEWDPTRSLLHVVSSIVGLPPIFIYRDGDTVAIASELRLFLSITNLRLIINPQAAVEVLTVGHPVEHRTLFRNVTLMPGGHTFRVDRHGKVELTLSWSPPELKLEKNQLYSIDLQAEAFKQSVRKLRLSETILSLTGGLDTRAILGVLVEMGVKLTTCTISGGSNLCLDARLARKLSNAYGLQHVVVTLGNQFVSDLPSYILDASKLSGGLSSVEQAHEVYFYRQLEGLGSRRLSGHLGNQLGRRGVERVSMRNADSQVLHDTIRTIGKNDSNEHWLSSAARRLNTTLLQLLLQYEVPFSSVGNYSIGHHFMVQQSPYASCSLIETSFRIPSGIDDSCVFAPNRARLRDLYNRFFGPPRSQSFQRRVIERIGGDVADCPINWGWRAKGGVSLRGLGWGLLTFVDAMSSKAHFVPKILQQYVHLPTVNGLFEITQYQVWFDTILREFVNDTLRSRFVTESDLFNATAILNLLDEHYSGNRSHYNTLVGTLDLVLAQQCFCVSQTR